MAAVAPTLPITAEGPQLLRRAEELKNVVAKKKDLYGDTEAWSSHQELGGLYRRLLLTDLEYALDKKVEQDLWNYCFKTYISHLQSVMRDKKNPNRGEAQMTLTWFLENASGFYILLLEELRQVFGLEIPFLQSSSPYGISDMVAKLRPGPEPQKSSCHYVCQHCLVHLGDIARYRSQTRQAETFYRHAISLAPSSGHPYNQIAILEASRGNRLATVYFYVRSVALRNPFPAATTNLAKMLAKLAGLGEQEGDESVRERTGKVTAHTFIPILLRVHGLLHHASRLKSAVKMSKLLTSSLTSLVATESFSTWQMIQIIAVNMWAWEHARAGVEHGGGSREERLVCAVVADVQAAILSATLLPVYTLKQGRQLLDYFALPAVKLLLEWVVSQPEVLRERGMTSRPEIWPSFVRILNEIEPLLVDFNPDQLHDYPLPEDYDLQSFQPLRAGLGRYNYKQVSRKPLTDQETLRLLRCCRLTEVGRSLSEMETPTLKFCSQQEAFVALELDIEPGEDSEVLAELLGEESEGESEGSEGTPEFEEDTSIGRAKGILKNKGIKSPVLAKKQPVRHNVAMAAILRRAGLENTAPTSPTLSVEDDKDKSVTFKTPSPAASQTSTQDSSSQYSASQEEQPAVQIITNNNNNRAKGRRGWSPPPVSRPKASIEDLDFTKPPPSLHSNYRPPALASPPLGNQQQQQHRVPGITSIGEAVKGETERQRYGRGESMSYHSEVGRGGQGAAIGRPGPAGYGQAMDYGGGQSLTFSGEGAYQEQTFRQEAGQGIQRQENDWWKGKEASPNSRLIPGFSSDASSVTGFSPADTNSLIPGYNPGESRRVAGFPPSDSRSFSGFASADGRFPPVDTRPDFSSPSSSHLSGFPRLPLPGHTPGFSAPQHMQMPHPHQGPSAPPNPLMQLLSASHQGSLSRDTPPGSSPGYALPDLGSLSLSQPWQQTQMSKMTPSEELGQSSPHLNTPLQNSPQHKNSPQHNASPQHSLPQHNASPQQTYSLFSPTSWPGPLLTQSQGSTPNSANTWSAQPQNANNTGGNMQLFGPGPSPLERLLHQAKGNK